MFHRYSEKPPVRQCAERGSKRKRHGEEYEEVDQNLEYPVDMYRERGMSVSSSTASTCGSPVFYASPVLGPIVCDDLPLSPPVLRVSTPEEAIWLSILERDFKSLSVIEGSDNTQSRPRASAVVYRPIAVRAPLAEVQMPVVTVDDAMDVSSNAAVSVGRSRSLSNPF